MADNMDKILHFGLIVMAVVSAYAVLTANHLFIG